ALVVVGDQLGEVLAAARQGLEPFGGPAMLLGASGARDLAIGHVTDERVAERVRRLAGDRRAGLAPEELLPLQRLKTLFPREARKPAESRERAGPRRAPDDGGVVDERLLVG